MTPNEVAVLDYGSQYSQLIARRIREIKEGGAVAAVSVTPMNTKHIVEIVKAATSPSRDE